MFLELLNKVAAQYSKKLPFVMYRKPDESWVHVIFQNNNQLHYVADYSETGFVFAPFETNNPTVLLRPDEKFKTDYASIKKHESELKRLPEIDLDQKEIYIDLVKRGIESIDKASFEKVVLSRRLEVDCESSPLELFQEILLRYNRAFCYLWYHPKVGMWSGATPEILLHLHDRQLTTMSLAGTQIVLEGQDPEWGNKELKEQELVTEYISEALRTKVSRFKVSIAESVRAGSLWHLRTKISGITEKGSLAEVIRAMHPTPAVCGMPMQETKNFILDNENYNREYYAGFLGELNFKKEKERASSRRNIENRAYMMVNNTSTLYVNLRCMQLNKTKAFIYIGGGVTKDSIPEKEWEETVAKSRVMLSVLQDKN